MRLLIVEDHEELWDFLSRRLQRRGFEVTVAQDGQDGLSKARSVMPDIRALRSPNVQGAGSGHTDDCCQASTSRVAALLVLHLDSP